MALPERRGRGDGEDVREEVGGLFHQVDAELIVVESDVDVHSADEHPPGDDLMVSRELVVTISRSELLCRPVSERVRGGRDDRAAMLAGHTGKGCA